MPFLAMSSSWVPSNHSSSPRGQSTRRSSKPHTVVQHAAWHIAHLKLAAAKRMAHVDWEGSSTKQTLERLSRESHKLRLRVSLLLFSLGAATFASMQAIGLTQAYTGGWNNEEPPNVIW